MNKRYFLKIDSRRRITIPEEDIPKDCVGFQVDIRKDRLILTPMTMGNNTINKPPVEKK